MPASSGWGSGVVNFGLPGLTKRGAFIASNIYAAVKGRKFGSWITDGGRSVGFAPGDLIENPGYIIESILRDELGLTSSNIDTASFDVVGNTTNGLRKDWLFARSLTSIEKSLDIIARICFEAHLIRFERANGKYAIVALDRASTSYNIIQAQMSRPPTYNFTSQSYIMNQFSFSYFYDYATNAFRKSFIIDETQSNFLDNGLTYAFNPALGLSLYGIGTASTGLCAYSQAQFKRKRKYIETFQWITDPATAELSAKRFMQRLFQPLIMVSVAGWPGDTTSGSEKPLVLYEIGDQCKVTHPLLAPTITNNVVFMVTGKSTDKSTKTVQLTLTNAQGGNDPGPA